jgi:MFS family permease
MKTEAAPPAQQPRISPHYKWVVVGLLWLICFFNYADRQAIFSVFKVLETEYGINKEEQGQIGAAFMIVYALTAPFAGQVGDRFSRKKIILGGLYVWSLVTGFTALCTKTWQFVTVRAAEGLGETFYFPASMSMISDYHGRATRSRAMSLHQTSVYAGTVGGGALAGWLAQSYGWQFPFILLGACGIVLGLVLAAFIREPQRNQAERQEASVESAEQTIPEPVQIPMGRFLMEWLRTPTAIILVLAFLAANFVAMQFLAWAPTFLNEKFKLSLASAGLGGTFFVQAGSMLGAVVGGVMADRLRQRMAGGRIATQALGALLGAPFIFLFGFTQELWVLVIAMSLFGIFKGVYDANIWASLYDVVPPSRRGAAVGLMNMVGWLGGSLGVYLMGRLVQGGMSMSVGFSSTALLYVIAAVLLFVGARVFAPTDIRKAQPIAVPAHS